MELLKVLLELSISEALSFLIAGNSTFSSLFLLQSVQNVVVGLDVPPMSTRGRG